jgi:glycerophosphoryl diester phosphodiesterase
MKGSFAGEPIPKLEEGLLLTLENNWKINLELKYFPEAENNSDLPNKTLDVIRQTKIPLTQVIISSFHHPWLLWIMEKNPA